MYLRKQSANRWSWHRCPAHQWHHSVTVDGTVHLPVGWQYDPWSSKATLTNCRVPPLNPPRYEEWASPAVAVLEGAVLIICKIILWAKVPGSTSKTEQTRTAVPPRREDWTTDTEKRLETGYNNGLKNEALQCFISIYTVLSLYCLTLYSD